MSNILSKAIEQKEKELRGLKLLYSKIMDENIQFSSPNAEKYLQETDDILFAISKFNGNSFI